MIETEIRTYSNDVKEIIERIINLGFEEKGKFLQHDIILDDVNGSLFKSGQKIRIRRENGVAELTFKGKFQSEEISKRDELNIHFEENQCEKLVTFLSAVGYPMLFQMKKERTVFKSPDGMIQITLDSFPIVGYMIEIEGDEHEIINISSKIAPGKIFKNYRLKEIFEEIMRTSGKSFNQLKEEYENTHGYTLGSIETII